MIILTGDHGQEFNDNGLNFWEHATNFTKYQVQTPLVIYWPKTKRRQINYVTNHFGIVPLLLTKILGVQNPTSDYSAGTSLFSPIPPPAI